MELQQKITYGILTLIIAYTIISNIEPTHYSNSLQEKRYCDRLSSTNKTCYPTIGTTIGKKYSSDGWKEIPFIEEILKIGSNSGVKRGDWICPKRPNDCLEVY